MEIGFEYLLTFLLDVCLYKMQVIFFLHVAAYRGRTLYTWNQINFNL